MKGTHLLAQEALVLVPTLFPTPQGLRPWAGPPVAPLRGPVGSSEVTIMGSWGA